MSKDADPRSVVRPPSGRVHGGQVKSPGAVNVPTKIVQRPTPPPAVPTKKR